jgi:hypothetical protein
MDNTHRESSKRTSQQNDLVTDLLSCVIKGPVDFFFGGHFISFPDMKKQFTQAKPRLSEVCDIHMHSAAKCTPDKA